MLATVELMGESAQRHLMKTVVPRWLREVPLYERDGGELYSNGQVDGWERLPLITKQDIRRGFPRNFLRPGVELEALLEQDIIEVEHTSGTSEERIPLLLDEAGGRNRRSARCV